MQIRRKHDLKVAQFFNPSIQPRQKYMCNTTHADELIYKIVILWFSFFSLLYENKIGFVKKLCRK